MSRSSEGDECGNSDIDEIDKKLQNISMDGREEGDADVDGNDDVDDGNDDNEHNSISEHEQSTMSQANYYDETSLNLNNLNHLFHIDFMRSVQNLRTHERRFKNGTRRSATFTNEQMRQIERENQILLKKILSQRPRSSVQQSSTSSTRNAPRVSSAAINRRYQQERIDFANNILRKKIEKIAQRNPK